LKDKFILGGTAGMAGGVVMGLSIYLLNLIPGISIHMITRVALLFSPSAVSGPVQSNIIGFIGHLFCSALVGFIAIMLLDYTGYSHSFLKGLGFGAVAWFALCGVLARILNLNMADKFVDSVLLLLVHVLFGVITVWIINRYRYREEV